MKSLLSPRLVTLAAVLACAVGPAIGTPPRTNTATSQ